jgi:hypothetical protein
VPLPKWKANPETDPDALFEKDTVSAIIMTSFPKLIGNFFAVGAGPVSPDYLLLPGSHSRASQKGTDVLSPLVVVCNNFFTAFG